MAELPATSPRQKASVPLPKALTTPVPVTTTRCTLLGWRRFGLRLDQLGDACDHLVDVLYLFGFLVINFDVEFAFKVKEYVEAIERINPQRLEAAVRSHTFERNTS